MAEGIKICSHCQFKCPQTLSTCSKCGGEFQVVQEKANFEDQVGIAIGYGICILFLWCIWIGYI